MNSLAAVEIQIMPTENLLGILQAGITLLLGIFQFGAIKRLNISTICCCIGICGLYSGASKPHPPRFTVFFPMNI